MDLWCRKQTLYQLSHTTAHLKILMRCHAGDPSLAHYFAFWYSWVMGHPNQRRKNSSFVNDSSEAKFKRIFTLAFTVGKKNYDNQSWNPGCVVYSFYVKWYLKKINYTKRGWVGAVVVAQLVEQSLLTPEVRGSNPVIGKILYRTYLYSIHSIEKTKIKKRPGMAQF